MPLPAGFQLQDGPKSTTTPNIPQGFVIEAPAQATKAKRNYKESEVLGAAASNFGKSGSEFYSNVAYAATHPIESAKTMGKLAVGTVGAVLPEAGQQALKNLTPAKALGYAMGMPAVGQLTPDGATQQIEGMFKSNPNFMDEAIGMAQQAGGDIADRWGSYENIKRTIAEDPVGALADISSLFGGGAGVLSKAGKASAASKLAKVGKYTNPLAPLGAAVDVGKLAISPLADVASSVFDPKNSLYLRSAEGQAGPIINALRNTKERVPGLKPTAAQAAVDTDVVGFQKLGRSSSELLETDYLKRESQNNAAISKVVRDIAADPKTRDGLVKIREEFSKPLYRVSDRTFIEIGPEFLEFIKGRPSMTKAFYRARDLAKDKGKRFLTDSGVPGTTIHSMKQALDDMIKDPATFGIGGSEAKAIMGLKKEFLDWVDLPENNPSYKKARDMYQELSPPINVVDVGKYLDDKLTPVLGDESAAIKTNAFATALNDAPKTIKRATGETRFDTLEQVFVNDKQSLNALYSVRDELSRQAKSQRMSSGPIRKEYDVERATEAVTGASILPNMINKVTTVSNDLFRRLKGKVDRSTAIEVAYEMLFPEKAANALEEAVRKQKASQSRSQALTMPVNALYRNPTLLNAMSTQNENNLQ